MNCELWNRFHGLYHGTSVDGIYTENVTYTVLRYLGVPDTDVVPHPDWYAVAWVSLLRMLPDSIVLDILNDSWAFSFASQADHVKYHIVRERAEEFMRAWVEKGYFFIVRKGDDLILCYDGGNANV